jgi:glycerophosphoryl diester phosphodiesterase
MSNPNHNGKPLIIAHRGSSAFAPENTLAAFRRAIAEGADGVEFDVRLTSDGIPVVFHDASLRRTALGKGKIIERSYNELKQMDVGSWFNQKHPNRARSEYSKETMPTLAKALADLHAFNGLIYIEMKCKKKDYAPLVRAVVEQIKRSEKLSQMVLKSFTLEAVLRTRELLPQARTAALFAPKISHLLKTKAKLIETARDCRADELSLHYSLATPNTVQEALNYGMPTTIWTADHPAWVRRAYNTGIRAIITNNPARLLAKRAELD